MTDIKVEETNQQTSPLLSKSQKLLLGKKTPPNPQKCRNSYRRKEKSIKLLVLQSWMRLESWRDRSYVLFYHSFGGQCFCLLTAWPVMLRGWVKVGWDHMETGQFCLPLFSSDIFFLWKSGLQQNNGISILKWEIIEVLLNLEILFVTAKQNVKNIMAVGLLKEKRTYKIAHWKLHQNANKSEKGSERLCVFIRRKPKVIN